MEIHSQQHLRERYDPPSDRAVRKQLAALDGHCRTFIAKSPFLVMGTAGGDGSLDVSPKGDAPGFVAVLDDRTLLIPDRPGNNRLDGFSNLVGNPHVGLLFLIPGVNETLRINGRARLTTDRALLEPLAVQGKVPVAGLRVEVQEAYLHCAKALIRSKLWNPASQVERSRLPTLGQMLADQIGGNAGEMDRWTEEAYRTKLY